MNQILHNFDWQTLLIVAIISSFVVEAFNLITPKWLTSKSIIFVVSLVVTLLRLPFQFETLGDYQHFGITLLFTMAFAILFYTYLGKWTVEKLFNLIKGKLNKEVDNA